LGVYALELGQCRFFNSLHQFSAFLGECYREIICTCFG